VIKINLNRRKIIFWLKKTYSTLYSIKLLFLCTRKI